MFWFITIAVAVTAIMHIKRNASRWAREYQAKRNAAAYRRYAQGIKDLEASMAADGTWTV